MKHDEHNTEESPLPGLRELPMRRMPSSDLWPGIEARLKPRRRANPGRYLAAAACVLAALGGLIGFNLGGTTVATPTPVEAPAQQLAAVRVTPRRVPSEADTRGLIRTNLRVIETTDRQIRAALKYDPDSTYLSALLETNRKQRHKLREMLAQQQT